MDLELKIGRCSVNRQIVAIPKDPIAKTPDSTRSTKDLHLDEIVQTIPERSKLVLPHEKYSDDFLRTMTSVMRWSRRCGALSGGGSRGARAWAVLIGVLLGSLVVVSAAGLARTLAKWTFHDGNTGAISSTTAGLVFYLNALGTVVLTWQLGSSWRLLATRWASADRALTPYVPVCTKLRRDMVAVVVVVSFGSTVEHAMSLVSAVGLDCPWGELLQRYTIASHGFLIKPDQYNWWLGVVVFIVSNLATVLWNLQDLVIVLLSLGLSRRYRRLNNFTESIVLQCKEPPQPSGAVSNDDCQGRLPRRRRVVHHPRPAQTLWRAAREGFARQAALVRHVDDALGPLMLLSFLNNFYFICLQMFNGISSVEGVIQRCYFIMSLFWMCARAAGVVLAASAVHHHSRAALTHAFACPSQHYSVEVHRLQTQMCKDEVALTGMRFFEITRSFLLKVSGAIITYEIVLVQFNESACN